VLLRPCKRYFTTIISWWFRTSSKLTGKKSKNQLEKLKIGNSKGKIKMSKQTHCVWTWS